MANVHGWNQQNRVVDGVAVVLETASVERLMKAFPQNADLATALIQRGPMLVYQASGQWYVSVLEDYFPNGEQSPEFQWALRHEIAHVKLNHLTDDQSSMAIGGIQILDDLQKEMQADAYASLKYGKAAGRAFLKSYNRNIGRVAAKVVRLLNKGVVRQCWAYWVMRLAANSDQTIKRRISALA